MVSIFHLNAKFAIASDNTCQTIRVNGSGGWYPVMMRADDKKQITGVAPEVAFEIFRMLGVKMVVTPELPWNRVIQQLDRGELDILLGAYWTSKRATKYAYTEAITKDEIAIFVRRGEEFPLSNLNGLIGRSGLRPMGGSYGEKFDVFAKNNLEIISIGSRPSDPSPIIKMLAAGRADYGILGRYDGISDIRSSKHQGKVTVLPWPVSTNDVHFMMSRKSNCLGLLDKINAAIKVLHENGFIRNLEMQYLKG